MQEKETLMAISRKYGVKLEDLKKNNSKLKDNDIISVGEKIRVPRDMVEVITQVSTTQTDTTFQYHKVKPKETLFSISRLYEVSIDEINQLIRTKQPKHGWRIVETSNKTVVRRDNPT